MNRAAIVLCIIVQATACAAAPATADDAIEDALARSEGGRAHYRHHRHHHHHVRPADKKPEPTISAAPPAEPIATPEAKPEPIAYLAAVMPEPLKPQEPEIADDDVNVEVKLEEPQQDVVEASLAQIGWGFIGAGVGVLLFAAVLRILLALKFGGRNEKDSQQDLGYVDEGMDPS